MLDRRETVTGGRRGDPETAAARVQVEVEDFIAASSESDALSRLQDFVGDFAPGFRDALMDLRRRHEKIRETQRAQASLDPVAVSQIRNDILELLYGASDEALRRRPLPTMPTASQAPGFDASNVLATSLVSAPQTKSADQDAPPPASAPKREVRRRGPGPLSTDVVCRLDQVTRSYGKGAFRLDPISLDIRRGEIVAVAGRNASGKTTLLRMMMGEILPTAGSVSFPSLTGGGDRRRPDWIRVKRQIAFMPQLPDKWHGRLRHNLNYVASAYGQRDQDLQKFVDWYLARFELLRFRNATWDEVSGGYKIRFELARAMLTQPKFLILDEPLAYLDVVARERFLRDIRSIANSAENPLPIVITSQHLSEIEAVADQIVLLDDGELKYIGKVADIAGGRRFKVLEVALDAPQTAVETALAGARLQGIEPTVEGYILAFPKDYEAAQVFARLAAAFGEKFTMMRDITSSVRAIMSDLGA